MKYLIGADIGTTGTKACLYDIEGHEIANAFEESVLHYPRPGWVEQNPEDFYTSVCHTISRMIEVSGISGRDIAAVTIDGQMAGILGIDKQYRAVMPYDSWLDTRSMQETNQIRDIAEDEVLKRCGLPTITAHCGKILWWKKNRPEIFRQTEKFIQPAAYVSGKMAGLSAEEAFIDITYCHFTGLYDFQKEQWSRQLCDLFEIPVEKLPKVVPPWQIVGTMSSEAAADCSLTAGIPIVAGCGDQAAGFLGAGMTHAGCIVDVAGTASVLGCSVNRFEPDLKSKTLMFSHAIQKDLWFPHAYLTGGGLCLRWFRDHILRPQKHQMTTIYREMDQKAEKNLPDPTGILFTPHLGGRNFPFTPDFRGNFVNLNWDSGLEHLYKSVMEGIGYEYQFYLNLEKNLFPDIDFREIRVYGGGAKSRVFTQIKADILGIPYVRLDRDEVGALGSVILGGYAVGIYRDMNKMAQEFTHVRDHIYPDARRHDRYQEFYMEYRSYIRSVEQFYQVKRGN